MQIPEAQLRRVVRCISSPDTKIQAYEARSQNTLFVTSSEGDIQLLRIDRQQKHSFNKQTVDLSRLQV